jgi:hypothetical protein
MEPIDNQQLLRFLELAAELQLFQNGNRRIEQQVIVDFVHADSEFRDKKIQRVDAWLEATWRTGQKPSDIPYSEILRRLNVIAHQS